MIDTMRQVVAHSVSLVQAARKSCLAVFLFAVLMLLGTTGLEHAEDYRYRWSSISNQELVEHFRKLIRIEDDRGVVHIGMLVDIAGREVRLRQARRDGGELLQINMGSISSVEVLDRFPR
jgi:hypothetical protein